jgi:hypothetical protein
MPSHWRDGVRIASRSCAAPCRSIPCWWIRNWSADRWGYGFYQVLVRALIELLGMQHRPDRFDFGWRYVERELPPSAQALIARHAFVPNGQSLASLSASLVDEITGLLDVLTAAESAAAAAAAISAAAPADRSSP